MPNAKMKLTPQPSNQPMPMAAPPTPPMPWPSELMPPERMQMMENEIAKFWKPFMLRASSWA
jgi:hypothetical protein